MISLRRLTIKGFRAYREVKEFSFDSPMVLLFGENARGKSSTLNAIEWCLFGNECMGKGTGIRERIKWELPNRNTKPPNVSVMLELEDKEGRRYVISRSLAPHGRRRGLEEKLRINLPEGGLVEGEEAKARLQQLVKLSFRDFLTTVYQHQEAIRAVLTQEPRERNDAIDRLLGLSDHRNILTGIEAARLEKERREIGTSFDSFAKEVEVALQTRKTDLKERAVKAQQKGLGESQLNQREALKIAEGAKDRLVEFAHQIGLGLPEIRVSKEWKDLSQFERALEREIKRFRSEIPEVMRQQDLFRDRSRITELREAYGREKENEYHARRKLQDFIKEKGTGKVLDEKIKGVLEEIGKKKKTLEKADARATLVRDALEYLSSGVKDAQDRCPLCGNKAANLAEHLKEEWEERIGGEVRKLQKEIDNLRTQLEELEGSSQEYDRLKEGLESAKKRANEVNRRIAKVLGREITERDDPHVLLTRKLDSIKKELKELEDVVSSRQDILDGIAHLLNQIEAIVDILNGEEKMRIVEEIEASPEYGQMEELKDELAILLDDIGKIKEAVGEVSHEEARQKVGAAEKLIDNYFRQIAGNPSVTNMRFLVSVDSRTARNHYEFKDQNGEDLTPVLSQGDLNALALSIFLGMATSGAAKESFGFVMLDDPSQSLGSGHKEKLIDILNEVLKDRIVILSSMDKELQDLTFSRITGAKKKYVFSDWTPEEGPGVKEE